MGLASTSVFVPHLFFLLQVAVLVAEKDKSPPLVWFYSLATGQRVHHLNLTQGILEHIAPRMSRGDVS